MYKIKNKHIPVSGKTMKKMLLMLILLFPSAIFAETRSVIDEKDINSNLTSLIAQLKIAVSNKDPYPIIRAISKEFEIKRDLGGLFNPEANAVENFLLVFPLNNSQLSEEYQDSGWKTLSRFVNSNVHVKTGKETCLCDGEFKGDMTRDALLCFKNKEEKIWEISSYVNAGD